MREMQGPGLGTLARRRRASFKAKLDRCQTLCKQSASVRVPNSDGYTIYAIMCAPPGQPCLDTISISIGISIGSISIGISIGLVAGQGVYVNNEQ